MTSYQNFLKAVFGNRFTVYSSYIYGLNFYCLFIVTLTISLCVYSLLDYKDIFDKTFEERVHTLRVKYASSQRSRNA